MSNKQKIIGVELAHGSDFSANGSVANKPDELGELHDAIEHARDVAENRTDLCDECRKDHEKLANWLQELYDMKCTKRHYNKLQLVTENDHSDYIIGIDSGKYNLTDEDYERLGKFVSGTSLFVDRVKSAIRVRQYLSRYPNIEEFLGKPVQATHKRTGEVLKGIVVLSFDGISVSARIRPFLKDGGLSKSVRLLFEDVWTIEPLESDE